MIHLKRFVTDPETGKVYPIPAGGSDMPPAGQQSEQTPEPEQPEGTPPSSDEEEEEEVDFSIAQQYLDGIEDPEVLKQLDPYVRKWDAGVTRRFQELHSQLKPYQSLGEYEELQQAAQLYQVLNSDPERVYNALAQALKKEQAADKREQVTPDPTRESEQTGQGLPPEFQEKFSKFEQVLNFLAKQYQESQQTTQQQQEDQALDEYLTNLKTEFGDFDEEYVLSKMMRGMSGEDAVKAFQQLTGNIAKKVTPNAPPVLSGGGSVSPSPIEPGKLSDGDTKKLVADLMAQAAQENA